MTTKTQCECCDKGCPEHEGFSECNKKATTRVRRIDMEEGLTVFYMCQACAEDAMESGVFA